jgi:archaellum biogenesis ATPase FlaH
MVDIIDPKTKEEEEEQPRYVIRSAAQAYEPLPPVEYTVQDFIPSGNIVLLYGESGSKKTYSMLSMAVCIAMGKPWLGFSTIQRKVLYIDEEMGESWLLRRLRAAIEGEFGTKDIPMDYVCFPGFKLDTREGADGLLKEIQEHEYKLVVLDSFSEIMTGDENSKEDTIKVFAAARRIVELTGCTIVIVHHPNRQGGYRGSSSIKNQVDIMIKVVSEDDSKFIDFITEKFRHAKKTKFKAEAHWVGEEQFYLTLSDVPNKPRPRPASQQYVIKYIKRHGASFKDDIAGAADTCSPSAAIHAIYALAKEGIIYRTNPDDKGKGASAKYDLAEEPQKPEAEND